MDLELIGRRIAEQRKYVRHISQEKMAEDLGAYQADISALEHAKKGSGISDLDKLQGIADYLQIPLKNLLFGSGREVRVEKYDPDTMELQWAGKKTKLSAKNRKMLAQYYNIAPKQVQPVIFTCGKFTIYILRENKTMIQGGEKPVQFGYGVLHFMVVFEENPIAFMDADLFPITYFACTRCHRMLQDMVDFQVFDVSDILRVLNPYIPLAQFSKEKEYTDKADARAEELLQCRDTENIILVERLYVAEDCRCKGICTMLLDSIPQVSNSENIWLNLEPEESENILCAEYGCRIFPLYSRKDIRNISINAGVAESLGFTIDPDSWHRATADIDDPDHSFIRNSKIRKSAYKLSPVLQQILENDGDLVDQGRALQAIAQKNMAAGFNGRFDFSYRRNDGTVYVQIPNSSDGTFLIGKMEESGERYLAVADTDLFANKAENLFSALDWTPITDMPQEEPVSTIELILSFLMDHAE